MSETKVGSKYIEKDPPMVNDPQLEKKTNDYLAYLKEKLNFILATYGRRLTDADGHVSELIRTAAEFAIILSQKVNEDEIIASINASAEEIKIQANRINLVGTTIVNGKIVATYTRLYDHNDYSQADLDKIRAYVLGTGTLTDEDWDKYDINEDGVIRMSDLIVIRNMILDAADILKTVVVTIDPANGKPISIQTTCTGSSNWTATSYIAARHINVGGVKCTGINSSEKVETPQVESRHSTGALSYKLNEDGLTFYDDANQVIGSYPKTGTNAGSDVVVEEKSQSVAVVAAGVTSYATIDVTKSGYTPLGIVGITGNGTAKFIFHDWFLSSSTQAEVWFTNRTSAGQSMVLKIRVLYKKN